MWPFKPNDWKIIYTEREVYTVYDLYAGIYKIPDSERQVAVLFTLSYSKSRNKYDINWNGYTPDCPQGSLAYQNCLEKQIELQNKPYKP